LLNLIKTGAESQTLSGGNVGYTGTTTVGQGTLILQQTTNFGSATTVAAGTTLELNGTADLQNNQVGARIALAGTLNRTGASGWMVWNGKLSPTSGTATLNLVNDGANPGAGVGWLFLDGGLGATGSQTLTINHTFSDGVTPNDNLSTVLRNNNSTYTGSLSV
jgi:autotransporter-associated beta strand protein